MLTIISYDIADDKKRTKLAKKLRDFGRRVQKSVFEADITEKEFDKLVKLLQKIQLEKIESIRLYRICGDCKRKVMLWGEGEITEDQDYYIV